MSSSIIPIIIETMMTIRTTPMSMKKRRRKTEEEKKETVMKMKNILEKTLAMALMAVVEVRTMIMNAKTVGKIKRKVYSGADDEEGSEDKEVVRTRTSSGDIVY